MALLSLRDVSLAFGGPRLLDHVDWSIERGERVCLLGRNGEGKSTLLRLVEGQLEADEGEVIRQQGLSIARLPQEVPEGRGGTHFSGGDEIQWIEERFPAAPKKTPNFWNELYNTLRKGKTFPITLEQARENMRIITLAMSGE